ncbi:MAG: PQQ-binding-like beta-propeller repeat protein [Pirellulales bacterium]|nr:PQQ-binding-like beta-propeller repeat protein [Pirellulales bacterium]
MRSSVMKCAGFVVLLLLATSWVEASDWPQWRGPFFNGSTDETDLPSQWSTTENIAWTAELPGCAAATPIISGDWVFLSGIDAERNVLQAMCFGRTDGMLRWRHDVAEGTRKDYRSTLAAPSPVTDGKLAVFFYSNGDLVCFDLDGKRLWGRNIQEDYGTFAFLWTFSSTPLLFDGKLYVQVLQRDVAVEGRGWTDRENESYLLALDPETGKTLWRRTRPSEARGESREAFSTPIPLQHEGTKQLLLVGGDALTGHDPNSGSELWRWGTWNPQRVTHWRLVASPVAGDGVILACGPKREPVYAIKAGGTGVLGDDAVAWASRDVREVSSDVPTPAFYDGDFFVLSDVRRSLSRVEPRTGKVKWAIATPGRSKYEASPLAADGKIYLINFEGEVAVVGAADGQLLSVIPMDEPRAGEQVRSSIAAAAGQLFIRTTRKLYCVGNG